MVSGSLLFVWRLAGGAFVFDGVVFSAVTVSSTSDGSVVLDRLRLDFLPIVFIFVLCCDFITRVFNLLVCCPV